MKTLKNTATYYISGEKAVFKSEVKIDSFFKTPVAVFTFESGKVIEISVKSFTNKLLYSDPIDFSIVYNNGSWYSDIREVH